MNVLDWARKIQAIAHNGLEFSKDSFDRERYHKLEELAESMVSAQLDLSVQDVKALWVPQNGYETPKVDARGAVFRDDALLLVRERSDGKWSLPGGWIDVNDSPSGAVVREIFEESGYRARALKLAAVIDRQRHPHPPSVHHIFKLFFLCELIDGSPTISNETDAVEFFPMNALPELSTVRVTRGQIERMYEHHLHPELPTYFD